MALTAGMTLGSYEGGSAEDAQKMSLTSGTRVGAYEVIGLIGSGGMGEDDANDYIMLYDLERETWRKGAPVD